MAQKYASILETSQKIYSLRIEEQAVNCSQKSVKPIDFLLSALFSTVCLFLQMSRQAQLPDTRRQQDLRRPVSRDQQVRGGPLHLRGRQEGPAHHSQGPAPLAPGPSGHPLQRGRHPANHHHHDHCDHNHDHGVLHHHDHSDH